jgi:hypothetical protein
MQYEEHALRMKSKSAEEKQIENKSRTLKQEQGRVLQEVSKIDTPVCKLNEENPNQNDQISEHVPRWNKFVHGMKETMTVVKQKQSQQAVAQKQHP